MYYPPKSSGYEKKLPEQWSFSLRFCVFCVRSFGCGFGALGSVRFIAAVSSLLSVSAALREICFFCDFCG
jgi:hypothetical protein